eukprot:365024-Chlamydomonas_euryale.AAC.4
MHLGTLEGVCVWGGGGGSFRPGEAAGRDSGGETARAGCDRRPSPRRAPAVPDRHSGGRPCRNCALPVPANACMSALHLLRWYRCRC